MVFFSSSTVSETIDRINKRTLEPPAMERVLTPSIPTTMFSVISVGTSSDMLDRTWRIRKHIVRLHVMCIRCPTHSKNSHGWIDRILMALSMASESYNCTDVLLLTKTTFRIFLRRKRIAFATKANSFNLKERAKKWSILCAICIGPIDGLRERSTDLHQMPE